MADFNLSADEQYNRYTTDAIFWYLGAPDFDQKLEPIEARFSKFTDIDALIIRKSVAQHVLEGCRVPKNYSEIIRASILSKVTKKVNWKREGF